MNRLPSEQDGGQANGWGIVLHKHKLVVGGIGFHKHNFSYL